MHRIASALAALARQRGAALHFDSAVRRIHLHDGSVCAVELERGDRVEVDAAVFNGDTQALTQGLLGAELARAAPVRSPRQRSLSALTWNLVAETSGFGLSHHNVFFSDGYRQEFHDILAQGRLPRAPTVYVCAQDRGDNGAARVEPSAERLLCLVNAPA